MAQDATVAGNRNRHRVRTDAERARAVRSARRHSLLVRIARNFLPIAAVVTLGAYFVSTQMNVQVGGISASIDGLEVSDGALRMLNPTMKGTDKKNGDYVITAAYADQDVANPNIVKLNTIKADVTNPKNGSWSRMRAVRGKFDSKKERLILMDRITLATSSGMTGELSYATVDMDKQILRSHNPVQLNLSNGTVRSNAMSLYSGENKIVFRGQVAVHLEPQKGKAGAPAKKNAGAVQGAPASQAGAAR